MVPRGGAWIFTITCA